MRLAEAGHVAAEVYLAYVVFRLQDDSFCSKYASPNSKMLVAPAAY
jgi:hypothetical protein